MKESKLLPAFLFAVSVFLYNSANYLVLPASFLVLGVLSVLVPLTWVHENHLGSISDPDRLKNISRLFILCGFALTVQLYVLFKDTPHPITLLASLLAWMAGVVVAPRISEMYNRLEGTWYNHQTV